MLVADRFADRRVFLVGESAHVNPPWGGHGFNTCVGDAVNIAWKIAAVEQGWAPPGLLASYEPERRGVAEQTVASAESNSALLADVLPRGRGGDPAGQASRVPQPGPGPRVLLRGSPVIQPGARPPAAARDVTSYTPVGRARRAAAAPLAAGRLVPVRPPRPRVHAGRAGGLARRGRRGPGAAGPPPRIPLTLVRGARRPTRGVRSSCWSAPTSTSPGGPVARPGSTSRPPPDSARPPPPAYEPRPPPPAYDAPATTPGWGYVEGTGEMRHRFVAPES